MVIKTIYGLEKRVEDLTSGEEWVQAYLIINLIQMATCVRCYIYKHNVDHKSKTSNRYAKKRERIQESIKEIQQIMTEESKRRKGQRTTKTTIEQVTKWK